MKTTRRRSIPLNLLAHLRGLRGNKQGFEALKPLSTGHSTLLKGWKCLETKPGARLISMFSRSPTRPSEPYSVESLYSLRERHYPRREIGQWRHPQAADDGQRPLRLRHLGKKVDRDESGRLEHEAYEHPQDGEFFCVFLC